MTVTSIPEVSFRSPDRIFIGGTWVQPSSKASFEIINPTTENPLFRIAEAKADDVDRAIAAAREAFDRGPWPRLTHHERAEFLRKFADGIRARETDLAAAHTGEMGVLYTTATMMIPR